MDAVTAQGKEGRKEERRCGGRRGGQRADSTAKKLQSRVWKYERQPPSFAETVRWYHDPELRFEGSTQFCHSFDF